jgi:hypothetical protein
MTGSKMPGLTVVDSNLPPPTSNLPPPRFHFYICAQRTCGQNQLVYRAKRQRKMPAKDGNTARDKQNIKKSGLFGFLKGGRRRTKVEKGASDGESVRKQQPNQRGSNGEVMPTAVDLHANADERPRSRSPLPSPTQPVGDQEESKKSDATKSPRGTAPIHQKSPDNKSPSTNATEAESQVPIGEDQHLDRSNSPGIDLTTQPTASVTDDDPAAGGPLVSQSIPREKPRQVLVAEMGFRSAVDNLQNLMLQIAGENNTKLIIDNVHIPESEEDFDTNVREIGWAVDSFMDKRTELRAQKGRVKEITERWCRVSLPFVKGCLNATRVRPQTSVLICLGRNSKSL